MAASQKMLQSFRKEAQQLIVDKHRRRTADADVDHPVHSEFMMDLHQEMSNLICRFLRQHVPASPNKQQEGRLILEIYAQSFLELYIRMHPPAAVLANAS
jgi:hypothetical protein